MKTITNNESNKVKRSILFIMKKKRKEQNSSFFEIKHK